MIIVRQTDDFILDFSIEIVARLCLDALREQIVSGRLKGASSSSDQAITGNRLTWKKFTKIYNRWLPNLSILQPYPEERFARQHQNQETHAVALDVRNCTGGYIMCYRWG